MKPKIDKKTTKMIFILLILIGGIFFVQQDFSIFGKKQLPSKQTHIKAKKNSPKVEENFVLNIEKLKITAPIILNVNGNNKETYNKALEGGVAHLTDSALPGKLGNTFIFGHSSFYAWKPGNYKIKKIR